MPPWITCLLNVKSGRRISWFRKNWFTFPELKSWIVFAIPRLFTFEQHVIEIFLQNSILMLYPPGAILASRQFGAAYWLIMTKTLVVGGNLLPQNFSFLYDREIMYLSLSMWKSCSEPKPYGPHIHWRSVTSVQDGILGGNSSAVLFHSMPLYVHSLFLPCMYFMWYALSEMTK